DYRAAGSPRLAYDIENPWKGEDEEELAGNDQPEGAPIITRIGFAYTHPSAGRQVLSVPWNGAYIPAIRMVLESEGEKVVWFAGHDNPIIHANGVEINGVIH